MVLRLLEHSNRVLKKSSGPTSYILALGLWVSPLLGAETGAQFFFSAGAGAVWEKGKYLFTASDPRASNSYSFSTGDNRFLGTLTSGLLVTHCHLRFGPYADLSYTPPSGEGNHLVEARNNARDVLGTQRPSIRWSVGLELGWQYERINPFLRAGYTRETINYDICDWQNRELKSEFKMEGITTGLGLNYAVTPSLFFGTSINITLFIPQTNDLIGGTTYDGIAGSNSLRENNLSFLVNARYVLDLKRRGR
jgi:opacity protein-like surface antigen